MAHLIRIYHLYFRHQSASASAMFAVTTAVLSYLAPPTRTVRHAPVVVRHTPVAASEAPPAEELIAAAKHFMNEGTGYYSVQDASLFAEDYVFRGPSIGPLNKPDYTSVMQYFMMYEAFEDFSPNAFGYTVSIASAIDSLANLHLNRS